MLRIVPLCVCPSSLLKDSREGRTTDNLPVLSKFMDNVRRQVCGLASTVVRNKDKLKHCVI